MNREGILAQLGQMDIVGEYSKKGRVPRTSYCLLNKDGFWRMACWFVNDPMTVTVSGASRSLFMLASRLFEDLGTLPEDADEMAEKVIDEAMDKSIACGEDSGVVFYLELDKLADELSIEWSTDDKGLVYYNGRFEVEEGIVDYYIALANEQVYVSSHLLAGDAKVASYTNAGKDSREVVKSLFSYYINTKIDLQEEIEFLTNLIDTKVSEA